MKCFCRRGAARNTGTQHQAHLDAADGGFHADQKIKSLRPARAALVYQRIKHLIGPLAAIGEPTEKCLFVGERPGRDIVPKRGRFADGMPEVLAVAREVGTFEIDELPMEHGCRGQRARQGWYRGQGQLSWINRGS